MHQMRYLIETVRQLEDVQYGASFHLFEREAEPGRGFKDLLAKPEGNPKIAKTPRLSQFDSNPKIAKSGKEGVTHRPIASRAGRPIRLQYVCLSHGGVQGRLSAYGRKSRTYGGQRPGTHRANLGYMNDRERFMDDLAREIAGHHRWAVRLNMLAAVRLNATSDVPWERVPFGYKGERHPNIMAAFPEVQFYDYTKIPKRALASLQDEWPDNYHITFSLSENNDAAAAQVLEAGGNVAMVFRLKPSQPMPTEYTINGVQRVR